MSAPSIPNTPANLSVAEIDALSQRQIKKHHVAIMLLHWFNAMVWLLEIATGLALISSAYFRIAPQWYISIVEGFFHSRGNMLHFHIAVGLTWTVVFLVYGTFGFRTYLRREVLEREIALDRDDFQWLKTRTLNLFRRSRQPLPPQGIYNAGQKMFAVMVYIMIPIIMASGIIMSFHLISTAAVAWAVVIHFVAVGMVVSGLMIHVYMGAVFPEEKPAFFSMITGTVNELYAYRHHSKWWKEMSMSRTASEAEIAGVAASSEQVSPAVESSMIGHSARNPVIRALRAKDYWPPYAAGFGLGLTLLLTFVIMGQGLGASGGMTRWVAAIVSLSVPGYAASSPYWSNYAQPGQSVLFDFLVFELIGVAFGAFISGWLAGRLRFAVDRGPHISNRTRYALALGGGILTGIGARLARGCTSGLALSGGAVLSVGAFVFMISVFSAGFIGAYFLRRYWL
jgi:formate dehydrogenase gamma subunit